MRAKSFKQDSKVSATRTARQRHSPAPVQSTSAASLLQLQRTLGNRFAQVLLTQAQCSDGEEKITPEVENAIQQARGGGRALDDTVRAKMESAFGADFSNVRLHTDGESDRLNHSLGARAFTVGQDIFFREGEYVTGTSSGRELLAHEMAHVTQQRDSQILDRLTLSNPEDESERQADLAAQAFTRLDQKFVPRDPDDLETLGQDSDAMIEPETAVVARSLVQRDGKDQNDLSFKQRDISYVVDKEELLYYPVFRTHWGNVPTFLVDDDSYFGSLTPEGGFWVEPEMERGVGSLGLHMSFIDYRDNNLSNDIFFPTLDARIRWEQRKPLERMTISPPEVEYDPDGGGGVQVTVHYSFGGIRLEGSRKVGDHRVIFNITYSSNMSTESSAGLEFGGEYGGASAKGLAGSKVSVGMASRSFTRAIAFHSY